MSKSEKAILNETLIGVTALPKTMAWRNNTGSAWQGEPVKARIGQTIVVEPGMKILRNARPIDFGLPGSGDILGACNGWPFMIETKKDKGHQSDQQEICERIWTEAGGIYILTRDPGSAVEQLAYYANGPLG